MTVARWRSQGWRPLNGEPQHPLEAAREQLDDAAPLLTGNPLTTAKVLVEHIVRSTHEQQDCIEFAVTETGIGMNADQMRRLFEEFSQGDASTARQYGGTGLGLAITRRLCQTVCGNAATFTVRLPVAQASLRASPEKQDYPTAAVS